MKLDARTAGLIIAVSLASYTWAAVIALVVATW